MEDKQGEQGYRKRALDALIVVAEGAEIYSLSTRLEAAKIILQHTKPAEEVDEEADGGGGYRRV